MINNNEQNFLDVINSYGYQLEKIITKMLPEMGHSGIDSIAASHAMIAYSLMLQAQNHFKIADMIVQRSVWKRESNQ